MSTVIFRLAQRTEQDADAFCELSNSLYARKVFPAYYDWQFFQCPHAPFLMMGWRDARLVAAYGVHVVAGPGPSRAMSLDIMISGSEQGKGLISDLAGTAMDEAKRRGAIVLSVVGNLRARDALGKRLGWSAWSIVSDWTSETTGPDHLPVSIVARPPARNFAASTRTFYPRDDASLAWRTSGPRYKYQWLAIGEPASPAGWAAVKAFLDPVTGKGFGDILGVFRSGNTALELLLSSIQNWFAAQGIGSAAMTPAGTDEEAVLTRLGFEPSTRHRYFCGLGSRPDDIAIGMLDIDVY